MGGKTCHFPITCENPKKIRLINAFSALRTRTLAVYGRRANISFANTRWLGFGMHSSIAAILLANELNIVEFMIKRTISNG